MNRQTSFLLILSAIFFPIPLYVYMKKLRKGLIVAAGTFLLTIIPVNLAMVLEFHPDDILIVTMAGLAASLGISIYYPFRLLFARWKEEKLNHV